MQLGASVLALSLCAIAACLPGPLSVRAEAASAESFLIMPGKSLGKLVLGKVTLDDAVDLLGAPTSRRERYLHYHSERTGYDLALSFAPAPTDPARLLLTKIEFTSPEFKTKEGVGLDYFVAHPDQYSSWQTAPGTTFVRRDAADALSTGLWFYQPKQPFPPTHKGTYIGIVRENYSGGMIHLSDMEADFDEERKTDQAAASAKDAQSPTESGTEIPEKNDKYYVVDSKIFRNSRRGDPIQQLPFDRSDEDTNGAGENSDFCEASDVKDYNGDGYHGFIWTTATGGCGANCCGQAITVSLYLFDPKEQRFVESLEGGQSISSDGNLIEVFDCVRSGCNCYYESKQHYRYKNHQLVPVDSYVVMDSIVLPVPLEKSSPQFQLHVASSPFSPQSLWNVLDGKGGALPPKAAADAIQAESDFSKMETARYASHSYSSDILPQVNDLWFRDDLSEMTNGFPRNVPTPTMVKEQDSALNRAYQQAIAESGEEGAKSLKQAQRAWLKLRQSWISLYLAYWPSRPKAEVERTAVYRITARRIQELLPAKEPSDDHP